MADYRCNQGGNRPSSGAAGNNFGLLEVLGHVVCSCGGNPAPENRGVEVHTGHEDVATGGVRNGVFKNLQGVAAH